MTELQFGVERIDQILKYIPPQKAVVIRGLPSVEVDIFGYQSLSVNSLKGNNVVLLLNRIAPEAYLQDLKDYGFDLVSKNVVIIDDFSAMIGTRSEAATIRIDDPLNPDATLKVLNDVIKENSLLIVDTFSFFIDQFGEEKAALIFSSIKKIVADKKASVMFLFTDWGYDVKTIEMINSLADAVINVAGIEKRVIFGQYFAVVKCNWVESLTSAGVLFRVVKPGGIKVYIPKILVTGPAHAGKSSFIHTACQIAHSANAMGDTVARDIGELHYKGYVAYLHGTPGQERFDPLLKTLGEESIGVILVVDATKPSDLPRALEMLRKTEVFGLPIVVVANKANLPGAMSKEEIAEKLHLDQHIPIVETVAQDLSQVKPDTWTYLEKTGVFEAIALLFKQIEESGRLEVKESEDENNQNTENGKSDLNNEK
jgi:small GTP-binding protein